MNVRVGCGGLRAIDAAHGEIKRMYGVPHRRGTGVAAAGPTSLCFERNLD